MSVPETIPILHVYTYDPALSLPVNVPVPFELFLCTSSLGMLKPAAQPSPRPTVNTMGRPAFALTVSGT